MSDFKSARDLYFDKLKIIKNKSGEDIKWDPKSKYAQAARNGLCFKCFREDTDPNHRPRHLVYGFCEECMVELSIGMEKIERQNKYEVHKWFKD